jgi:transcriptional regulator with XRE-family HTH domain
MKAARALAGLEQREVARRARIDPTTLGRMEAHGPKPVRGHANNVEAVITVLLKAGVEITSDGVRLISANRARK